MTDTTNAIVSFRCPVLMKERMKAYAEAKSQKLSTFIRFACAEALRHQQPIDAPHGKQTQIRGDQ